MSDVVIFEVMTDLAYLEIHGYGLVNYICIIVLLLTLGLNIIRF